MKVDSFRIQSVEKRVAECSNLEARMDEIKDYLMTNMQMADQIKDSHRFLERTTPMMIHFQLCEGLNIVAA